MLYIYIHIHHGGSPNTTKAMENAQTTKYTIIKTNGNSRTTNYIIYICVYVYVYIYPPPGFQMIPSSSSEVRWDPVSLTTIALLTAHTHIHTHTAPTLTHTHCTYTALTLTLHTTLLHAYAHSLTAHYTYTTHTAHSS